MTHGDTSLSPQEQLLLHQLLQKRFWAEDSSTEPPVPREQSPRSSPRVASPPRWELTKELTLHDWQQRCIEAWFANGKRGVIKVVTGAGKTILALAIAERLQHTDTPDLRVAIVVPTIVLMDQWHEELLRRSNLPLESIGLSGGGFQHRFSDGYRILICVLNSAAKKLPLDVQRAGVAENLLLVVDECHRAGAAEMRRLFDTKRASSLGLSATPERDSDPIDVLEAEGLSGDDNGSARPFEDTLLGHELGKVVFEMNYAEAIRLGVLPPFQIAHYGLSLSPEERSKYEALSREIQEIRSALERPNRRGLGLIRWCRSSAGRQNPKAIRLLTLTTERKRLLYRMRARAEAVLRIMRNTFDANPETKAILFHESVDEVMRLFETLRVAGYPVVAEHSRFSDPLRAESIRLFRDGPAKVIVSARSLIEGFNVPSADLGIVVAASSSIRQRVQTLGRLLRRVDDQEGRPKQALLCVLYASETVDELIYEKTEGVKASLPDSSGRQGTADPTVRKARRGGRISLQAASALVLRAAGRKHYWPCQKR